MAAGMSGQCCTRCLNGGYGFFCALPRAQRDRLEYARMERRYARGEVVFREGDPAHAMYCIQRGAVKLYKLGQSGEEVVIRLLGVGEIMGYRPMFAKDPFAATAVALEDSVICTIPRAAALATLRESPDLALRLLEKLAVELRVSEEQMMQRSLESVPQRTARFLLWLHENSAAKNGVIPFGSILRREDMAMAIGTTPETFSRTLHELERRQIIGLARRAIHIRHRESLERLALEGDLG